MAAGIIICSLPPFVIEKVKRPSWNIAHPDEVLVDVDVDAGAPVGFTR